MKKIIAILTVITMVSLLSGCGNVKEIDGVTYNTYGILNQNDEKNPNIKYQVSWGNVVWGAILIETIVAPIYFFGFSMFEPVGKIDPNKPKGVV